jgi:hypothetical protein
MARSGPVVEQALADARDVVRKAKGEGYDRVMAVLDQAREGMTYATDVARRADELMTTRGPELGEIITSASLAAQELKLTMTEVRAAPWRLLYQPNKKELENELLYNSIRQYSHTLGEVKAAAAALESATRNLAQTPEGQRPAVPPESIAALAARLRDSLAQSQQEEQRFFDRWVRNGK